MKIRGFGIFYGTWLTTYVTLIGIIAQLVPEAVLRDRNAWIVTSVIVVVLPFLVMWLGSYKGRVGGTLRWFLFHAFRVRELARVGMVGVSAFIVVYVVNLFRGLFIINYIWYNVILLNLLFFYFLVLVALGKFQVNEPPALLVQQADDGAIYLVQGAVIRHVPDPPTLRLMGYSFADVAHVTERELSSYVKRPPIPSVIRGRVVTCSELTEGKPRVWIVLGEQRREIPDALTLEYLRREGNTAVVAVDEAKLAEWPEGAPLTSVTRFR